MTILTLEHKHIIIINIITKHHYYLPVLALVDSL